jgi:4-hydroxybutyryl-CoA dehydratase / vinylacetyl-CoA-Delta-isomerase
MALKTKDSYIKSISELNTEVFLFGQRVKEPVSHPFIRASLNSIGMSYELAQMSEYKDLFTATSNLTGEVINRFTHIQQDNEDLKKKIKMLRVMGQKTASCFQRCAGLDALNTISSITFEIDDAVGTNYHQRFTAFLKYIQEQDLVCSAAMTDPKGDRSLRPGLQKSPDNYLRIIKENENGIIVRGAKAHLTGAINAHEILVFPTRAMGADEKEYSVAFAAPSDSKGIFYVYGRQPSDTRRLENNGMEAGNINFGGQEALVVFEDVFVPTERIFLKGETQFCRSLVERFASFHRASYGGCKSGVIDVLIGAAALIAEMQGTQASHHIRDKLVEMTHLNETLYATGIASASEGYKLASGGYAVNPLLANVCKLHVTRAPFEIARLAQDIAGGIVGTLPSEIDFKNPEIGPRISKYLEGVSGIPGEARYRIVRLIENMTMGAGSVCLLLESIHGAGSPQAQRVMIERQNNLEFKKGLARTIAGLA